MINDKETMERFGYLGSELSNGSHKKIVSECDTCGKFRIGRRDSYRPICMSCAKSNISNETRQKMSDARTGTKASVETKAKMSIAQRGKNNVNYGKAMSQEQKDMISKTKVGNSPAYNKGVPMSQEQRIKITGIPKSELHKIKLSCIRQGINIEDWEGFIKGKSPYCIKFNNECRERNRNKYNRECFICGKPECDNITCKGVSAKLSVHHIDRNKNQGCGDYDWALIPVCMNCHSKVHSKVWENRILYLIKEDVKSIEKEKEKQ